MHDTMRTRPEAETGTMPYFPIFVGLQGRSVLLLGGGAAAASKARLLLKAGAAIRLVAPEVEDELRALVDSGRVTWLHRRFLPQDLEGVVLAIDGSEEVAQTETLRHAARTRNILVNVVDRPEACDFTVPAILDRAPVVVAISSGGCAPALSRNIRQRLETAVPEGYARIAAAAAACREAVKAVLPPGRSRQRFWDGVLDSETLFTLEQDEIERCILRWLDAPGHVETAAVTFIGAGPGDPGLLTLHAAEALRRADVLLHDAGVGRGILEMARREARLVELGGVQCGQATLMAGYARAGQRVVRLRRGNPFQAGQHCAEAAELERQGLPLRIIPGVAGEEEDALEIPCSRGITSENYNHKLLSA